MSEDAKSKNSNVHVGSPVASRWRRMRWVILGVVGVILLAFAVGATVKWYQNRNDKENALVTDPGLPRAVDQAQREAATGDPAAAHKTLDEALKKTGDKTQKQALLIQQGITYENQKQYDQAITSYRQAEQYGLTFDLAQRIAQVAQTKGDNTLAIEYYKKTIKLLNPKDRIYAAEKQSFEDIIRSLGGQP